jgi:sulfur carrier protein ThiS
MITVKVIELPGAVREVALNDGATVADSLTAAGVSAEGWAIKVDSTDATPEPPLVDGSRVIIAKSAKGNA